MCILLMGENGLENIACLKTGSGLKSFYYLWTTLYLTQRLKVKVTEPKTVKNIIFDRRYPLISSFTVQFTCKGH